MNWHKWQQKWHSLRIKNVYFIVNAYLVYAILIHWLFPMESIYLKLSKTTPLMNFVLMMLALGYGFYTLEESDSRWRNKDLFVVLIAIFLGQAMLMSPSILMILGLFVIGLAIYLKLYLDQADYRVLLPLAMLASLPHMFNLLYHGPGVALSAFQFELDKLNGRQVSFLIFSMICCSLLIPLAHHIVGKLDSIELSIRTQRWIKLSIGMLILAYVGYLSWAMAAKVTTFGSSTFDMGIFTQMFANMKCGLGPVTTLERDRLLSHFSVHVSPIYYLMLPFYALFPSGETLQVLQVITVFSAVIPLKLCLSRLKLPTWAHWLVLILFTVTPAMTTAGSYDLHENCFLVPLCLWLLYANLANWRWRLALIVGITLMVKEDAIIYVMAIGLFAILQKRFPQQAKDRRLKAVLQLLVPIIYFGACLYYLTHYGDGAMVTRFDNLLLPNQAGLSAVLTNIILNPTYSLVSLFTQTKLTYLLLLLAGMAFMPLFQREWQNFILLIPLVVINLLSDYPYQADFHFQYSYGSNVLVLFMACLAFEALYLKQAEQSNAMQAKGRLLSVLLASLILSAGLLHGYLGPLTDNLRAYQSDPTHYQAIRQDLAKVSRNQRILAFAYYTVELQETKELYDIFYHNKREVDPTIDSVILPRSYMTGSSVEAEVVSKYLKAGYKETAESTNEVVILKK
ncbi:DUF2079 domain-containing protein [Vaginisenegalia massiliensis]|uniref:DUF2079 domain-containing protein n=1 Tax=Vaginisenegalia massiliensis TaxID=2058294 RepID=UPI000F52AE35|nr:DUF2079 domain-containing protein [Vaginisenegalia massiliensis]